MVRVPWPEGAGEIRLLEERCCGRVARDCGTELTEVRRQVIPKSWFIEKYDADYYGLKCTDPHDNRGVPEGTWDEWDNLITSMAHAREFKSETRRLSYTVKDGIASKNTNKGNTPHDERFLVNMATGMRVALVFWLREQFSILKDAEIGARSPRKDA